MELERSNRDLRSLQDLLEKSNRAYSDDKRTSEAEMKALEDRLHVMVAQKEEALARKREVQDMNAELRLIIDRMRAHVHTVIWSILLNCVGRGNAWAARGEGTSA